MIHIHQQIHNHLLNAQNIVIVPHQNPDGDALGSASALSEYLKKIGKQTTTFCLDTVPSQLQFLPQIHTITNKKEIFVQPSLDTIIVLDSGDLRYAGIAKFINHQSTTIINIDHHPTNENYGQINLVDPQACSTTAILYYFFRYNNIRLTRHQATSLLTGIITDTSNFSNDATNISAIIMAGDLLRSGANLSLINKCTLKNNSVNMLKLWGQVLNRLEHQPQNDLAYTYLTRKDYIKFNIKEKEADGIANFMNSIAGVKIGLFIKETAEGKIKGSFRTTDNEVDVSALAKKFGGGGHKKAAGFTTEGTMKKVLEKILTMEG